MLPDSLSVFSFLMKTHKGPCPTSQEQCVLGGVHSRKACSVATVQPWAVGASCAGRQVTGQLALKPLPRLGCLKSLVMANGEPPVL